MLVLLSLLTACDATCSQACKKLDRCDAVATSGQTRDQCEETCQEVDNLYDRWEDEDLQERLDASRNCIRDETCGAIADGVCYDEELYTW
jgi:hypothetical protein